jgi:hypothetical protein
VEEATLQLNDPSRQIAQHAIVKQAIPVAILLFLLVACAGCLPPWSVCGVLFIGTSTAWAFHVTKRDSLAISIFGLSAVTCIVLLWPRVYVREAISTDKTYDRYFGAPHENSIARNIAVAEGTFTLGTWLTGHLYHVQDGEVQELNAFSVGRTPNAIGAPHWVDMRITLALVTYDSQIGSITQLASAGQSRGGGHSSEISTSVSATHKRFHGGRLLSGQTRILYIEGDSSFTLNPGSTVESFAESHKGNFYVVVAGLE